MHKSSWPCARPLVTLLITLTCAASPNSGQAADPTAESPLIQFVEDPTLLAADDAASDQPSRPGRTGRIAADPEPAGEQPVLEDAAPAVRPRARRGASVLPGLGDWGAGREDRRSPAYNRLASIPNMFGDFYQAGPRLVAASPFYTTEPTTDLPLAGSCGRLSVADNNQAFTQDRVYLLYNHFENAVNVNAISYSSATDKHRNFPVDRYTIGFEKTLVEGLWSVQMSMPFSGQIELEAPISSMTGGTVGNLSVVVKRLLYATELTSVAAGLGIDTPTGSDVSGHVNFTTFTIHNEAVHLVPYLGISRAPDERVFWHGFLQVDVPVNGNSVTYRDMFFGDGTFGSLSEQTLLHIDVAAGYWLFHDESARLLTGLAPVLELHYTTSLNNPAPTQGDLFFTSFNFENPSTVDVLDATVGLHSELRHNTLLRVGGAFPLRTEPNRTFAAELQVQLERRF